MARKKSRKNLLDIPINGDKIIQPPFCFAQYGGYYDKWGGDVALTEKQKAFVREYLVDLNATQAAIRAGYSEKNADKIGSQLLDKTRVSEAISEALQERAERTEITQDKVLEEIAKYAFKEASDALDSNFKHSSKTKYIDMLFRHLGMNEPKQEKQDDNVVVVIDV